MVFQFSSAFVRSTASQAIFRRIDQRSIWSLQLPFMNTTSEYLSYRGRWRGKRIPRRRGNSVYFLAKDIFSPCENSLLFSRSSHSLFCQFTIERTSHTYSLTSCVSISYDSNAIFGTWRTLFRWQILFIFA